MNDSEIRKLELEKLIYLRERELGINYDQQVKESELIDNIMAEMKNNPSLTAGVDLSRMSIMDNLNIILYNLQRANNIKPDRIVTDKIDGLNADIKEYSDIIERAKLRAEIIEKCRDTWKGDFSRKIKRLNRRENLTEREKEALKIYKMELQLSELIRSNKDEALAFIEKYSSQLNEGLNSEIELLNQKIKKFAQDQNIPLLPQNATIFSTAREVPEGNNALMNLESKQLTSNNIKSLIKLGMGSGNALTIKAQISKHQENALALVYLKQKLLSAGNNPVIISKIEELEKEQRLIAEKLVNELMISSQNLQNNAGKIMLANLPRDLKEVDYILNALQPIDEKALAVKQSALVQNEDGLNKGSTLSVKEKSKIEEIVGEIIDDENDIDLTDKHSKQLEYFIELCARNFPELFADNNLNLYMDNPTPYDKFMAMYENLQKHLNEKEEYKEAADLFEKFKSYYDKRIKELQDYKERLLQNLKKLLVIFKDAKEKNFQDVADKLRNRINALEEKISEVEKALDAVSLELDHDNNKEKIDDQDLDKNEPFEVEFREIDPKEEAKDDNKDQEKESQKDDAKKVSPDGNETKPGNDEAPEKEEPKQIGAGTNDNPEGHNDSSDDTMPGDGKKEEGKDDSKKEPVIPLLPPHVIKLTDEQKSAYEEIVRQGIGKFSNTEFTDNEVADFVNNHPLISKFAGPDEAQIKENIKNDILKYCKKYEPEIPEDDEEEKKDWKALLGSVAIFTGGFATGLALSCVPGVGTIRMAMATAKLGVSAVNFVSEKLGHGKIINISQKIEQLKNSKFAKKHPKIAAGVDKAYEVLTSKEFNLFVNGVSAGYITGNVIEMVTGKTVLENIKSTLKPEETVVDTPSQNFNQSGSPEPSTPEVTTQVPDDIPVDLTPVQGQTYDLSEIAKGYVASGNKDAVNLITSAGKDAVFDRAVTAGDGSIWYHFKQANGLGYAWFPKDVVEEVIGKSMSH